MFQESDIKLVPLQYVEVVIPLAVPGTFTYLVPDEFCKMVTIGCRVSVQFGKNKIYAGIVLKIHNHIPEYRTKPILAVLDEFPMVYPQQLGFWEWMSQYYACYLGEVMNAALPIGLKLSSETKVIVNEFFDGDISLLTSKELAITDALSQYGELTIQQISKILNQQKVIHIIRGLIDKKVVAISEEMEYRYRPKVEEFITISEPYCLSELQLSELLDQLNEKKQTYKQMLTLMGFVKLCNGDYGKEILKSELLKEFECSPSSVASLIRKNIFVSTRKQVSRLKQLHTDFVSEEVVYSAPQIKAVHEMSKAFSSKDTILLHGVTGSGKTEIYIHFIKAAVDRGEQVLYLLPEIALTGQIVERLQCYFGNQVGVYHSKFNEFEQVEIWECRA